MQCVDWPYVIFFSSYRWCQLERQWIKTVIWQRAMAERMSMHWWIDLAANSLLSRLPTLQYSSRFWLSVTSEREPGLQPHNNVFMINLFANRSLQFLKELCWPSNSRADWRRTLNFEFSEGNWTEILVKMFSALKKLVGSEGGQLREKNIPAGLQSMNQSLQRRFAKGVQYNSKWLHFQLQPSYSYVKANGKTEWKLLRHSNG